jgi:2',3'-cyclic-nucleotide 2'-phosphodiesterase (5'-nucleotidase family)
MVELMARAGCDALVVGNHEFDYGLDTLRARMDQAGFPFLGANLRDAVGQPLLPGHLVVRKEGIRIGLVGLVSPGVEKVLNAQKVPGLRIGDPHQALRAALDSLKGGVDYWLVLAHTPQEEAQALGQAFPEVHLIVAGGFRRPERKGVEIHRVELANGVRLVSVPERGAFVGRVDVAFARRGEGWVPVDFDARLIPVDASVPQDEEAARRIAAQVADFARVASESVGRLREPIEDAPRFVADLLRTHLGAEVGLINLGALRHFTLEDRISRGDIDSLVRYDDVLVQVKLTGKQLRQMAESSEGRSGGQRLVFSGYDEAASRVNGRPLDSEELYAVATTGFLAGGGDGYFSAVPEEERSPGPTLKEALIRHIASHPDMGRWDGLVRRAGGAWKGRAKVSGSLARTAVNAQAGRYRGVSFLGGRDAMTWNSLFDGRLSYEGAAGLLATQVRSSFGQVKSGSTFKESADRLEVESVYTWQHRKPAPFLSLNLNTVWTRPGPRERPLTGRGSAGLQRGLGQHAKVRLGLSAERDFATEISALGLELVPEYSRKFGKGNSLSSSVKVFAGATQARKVSVQQYNALLVNLLGNVYLTIDANFFLHRDTEVDELGLKSEVQMGLGYNWGKKWFKGS